jgi:DNA polymerase III subunit beta
MDIVVTKAELTNALARVQGIVERKNTVPILSCVLLEAHGAEVSISATDLEIFLRSRHQAQVAKEGAVTAPAKKLFEIVREFPDGDVRLVAGDKGWLRIEMGRARFKVMSLPNDDFPALPEGTEGEKIEIAPALLVEAIEKTGFAMSHDQTRQALNGILLEVDPAGGDEADLRLIATDGHRLAFIQRRCRASIAGSRGMIVPRKAITEVRKLLGDEASAAAVEISLQENRLFVRVGLTLMVTRLVDGQFPDYRQVIPTGGPRAAVVEKEPFYRAVRRVATVTADRVSLVRFSFLPDRVAVTAVNPELGEASEDVAAECTGGDIELGMNARYVMDVFSVIEQEKVVIEMNEALSPALIRPLGDDGYRCVVMPMRL